MKLSILATKGLYQLSTINRKKFNKTFFIEGEIKKIHGVNYSESNDKKQVLDIYTPDILGKYPVVVHVHGGGWTLGDKDDNSGYCAYIASKGYVSVGVNYTLAPKAPHPTQERIVCDAFRWIAQNIETYGGDPDRIFLSGDSGGAHLVSTVANVCTNPVAADIYDVEPPLESTHISGMILFYGAYDFLSAKYADFPFIKVSYESFLGTLDDQKDYQRMKRASPIYYVTKDFPRSILLSGAIDGLHASQTLKFAEKLQEKNVSTTEVFFDKTRKDAVHGFMVDYSRACTKASMEKILIFLNEK
ncbi:alpha/beta hydrolase (plasmid) [Enterococcus sp. 22-H-5-01]|uniref:alpha/beta hydrolase n=1 Tax=Enterococcus sp. 22-H-5-01 TaxID=3418555 RepID=UPI003CFD3E08